MNILEKVNKLTISRDRIKGQIYTKNLYNGISILTTVNMAEFIMKALEDNKKDKCEYLKLLSATINKLENSERILKDNLDEINDVWHKHRLESVDFNEDKINIFDFASRFSEFKLEDIEDIKINLIRKASDTLKDVITLEVCIEEIEDGYNGDYLSSADDISKYTLDVHNNKLDLDYLDDIAGNVEEINVRECLKSYTGYYNNMPIDRFANEVALQLAEFDAMKIIFYLNIPEIYKEM